MKGFNMGIERPNKKIEKDDTKKGLIESLASQDQNANSSDIETINELKIKKPKKKMKQKMFYCPPEIEAAILIRKAKTGQDISEIVCEAIQKDLEVEIEQARNLH